MSRSAALAGRREHGNRKRGWPIRRRVRRPTEAPEYGKDGIVCDGSGCHVDVSLASECEANADQKSAGKGGRARRGHG